MPIYSALWLCQIFIAPKRKPVPATRTADTAAAIGLLAGWQHQTAMNARRPLHPLVAHVRATTTLPGWAAYFYLRPIAVDFQYSTSYLLAVDWWIGGLSCLTKLVLRNWCTGCTASSGHIRKKIDIEHYKTLGILTINTLCLVKSAGHNNRKNWSTVSLYSSGWCDPSGNISVQ